MGSRIDHLVVAGPELAGLAADIASRYGVSPIPGGAHPGRGTRNELLGLGEGRYLELIGPDPEQPPPRGGRPFGVDAVSQPALVTWCARPQRPIHDVVVDAAAAGFDLGPVVAMSRARPDGVLLQWHLTITPLVSDHEGTMPFLIDWGSSPHPSASLPGGLELVELILETREPSKLRELLTIVGDFDDVTVEPGNVARLRARLRTPLGELELH
jgi:hypothetical protein